MQQEIEVKFVDVNTEQVRQQLIGAGAKLVTPMRLMRRVIMDFPGRKLQVENDGCIRIRDEGDKIRLTYKEAKEGQFGGAREIEVTVDSLEKTEEIFKVLGLETQAYQESRRETWAVGKVEVVIDEWPWLEPMIEIEGPTEEEVKQTAALLGFSWDKAVFGTVVTAYRAKYPNINSDEKFISIPVVKFDLPMPDWFKQA